MAAMLLGACDSTDPRITRVRVSPAACGAASYQWLGAESVGIVEQWKELPLFRLSPEGLTNLASSAGIHLRQQLLYSTAVYQFRYRTQDRGRVDSATSLLAVPVPPSAAPPEFPVLLYLHGSAGFSDKCAPSGGLGDPLAAALLASMGYVVVGPDYLGLVGLGDPSGRLHPYVIGEPTAIASLDAVRAARRLLPDLPNLRTRAARRLVVLGGSQGGHAALFTTRYQPYYAPEEPIVATVASVPPADLVGESGRVATELLEGSANLAAILTAMADWYGADLAEVLREPYRSRVTERMGTQCGLSGFLGGAISVADVFTESFLDLARRGFPDETSRWSCMLRRSSLPHTPVEAIGSPPTLVVLSEADRLVHTPTEREAVLSLCAQGLRLEHLECAGVDHTEGARDSLSAQIDFLGARLQGVPWAPDRQCRLTDPVPCSSSSP